MGNGAAKERFEKAERTKILSASGVGLDDWDDVAARLRKAEGLRSADLSANGLRRAVPRALLGCVFLRTLKSLDLGRNAIDDITAFGGAPFDAARPGAAAEAFALALKSRGAVTLPASDAAAGAAVFPLESLLLGGNAIAALPPFLGARFPALRVLDVSGNRLAGPCAAPAVAFWGLDALATLDLSGNALTVFTFEPDTAAAPGALQRLSELRLGGNAIAALGGTAGPLVLAAVRSIDATGQRDAGDAGAKNAKNGSGGGGGLRSVDPAVFDACPRLNSLAYDGPHAAAILVALKTSDAYRRWEAAHAGVVDRQIRGGADAKLMK